MSTPLIHKGNKGSKLYVEPTALVETPEVVENTAASALGVSPGAPCLYAFHVLDAASGNFSVVVDRTIRVIDAWCVKRGGDGHATEDTIVVGEGANAITDAMAIGANNDDSVTRAATIDDANYEIAAGGSLRITWVKGAGGGNDPECDVFVLAIRVP